jgi:hypothetical protein
MGEVAFFTGIKCIETAVSQTLCRMLVISKAVRAGRRVGLLRST